MEILKQLKQINIPQINPEFLSKLLGRKSQPAVPAGPSIRLACDFGKSKIVMVEIEKSQEGVKLSKFFKIPRSTGKDADLLKSVFEKGGFASNKVRISVKGQGVIIRFVQFPQMKAADLKSAISFELDQYIPFKAHEVIWDCQILEENVPVTNGMGMNVLLIAVKRDDLYTTIQTFQTAGLQIELIDVDAVTLSNVLEYFHPEEVKNTTAILDIGTEVSTLSVIHNGKPRFIRDITYGGVDILKRLRRKLGLTQEQAIQQIEVDRVPTPEATTVIKEALGDLVSELRVSLNYYLDQIHGAEPVKKLFIAGGGGYHPLVIETLTQSLGFPTEVIQVLGKIQMGPGIDANLIKQNQGILTVALGLCVREL
jgi:type IV pilus assembly protein PilM